MAHARTVARWLALVGTIAVAAPAAAQVSRTLAQRIGHSDPGKFRPLVQAVHEGAGTMDFAPILGADALSTNLIFVHRGVIKPHSGIGEHFHNQCEEMFVILDGEAQFTIDGRTSVLRARPACPTAWGIRTASTTPPTSRCSG